MPRKQLCTVGSRGLKDTACSKSMAASAILVAKRALVHLLLAFAQQYHVVVNVNRDSSDAAVEAAFRSVVKKVHPDKGGRVAHAQRLQAAREKWREAKAAKRPGGRPRKQEKVLPVGGRAGVQPRPFLVRSAAVLLTYHGIAEAAWSEFLAFVRQGLTAWGVVHWCATMERCVSGSPHVHAMLQFSAASDTRRLDSFSFQGARPNASVTDVCGEGLCKRSFQRSVDRGMFYVFADKIGTVFGSDQKPFTEGNYLPCWTFCEKTYQVLGKWPETLWKQRKISSAVYEELLFLTRDGVVSRRRNLQACLEQEECLNLKAAIEERVLRIRSNSDLYKAFPEVPEAKSWLQLFQQDALRYPIMVVLGPSRSGKTEWAKSLFKRPLELKIGALEFFPETMRQFKRGFHDGLVLDDVRDLQFLVDHQEKLQGKYDCPVEFGSTAGGTCAYHRDLFGVPVVATVNFSTKNLQYLDFHDWLANPGNRVLVQLQINSEFEANV